MIFVVFGDSCWGVALFQASGFPTTVNVMTPSDIEPGHGTESGSYEKQPRTVQGHTRQPSYQTEGDDPAEQIGHVFTHRMFCGI